MEPFKLLHPASKTDKFPLEFTIFQYSTFMYHCIIDKNRIHNIYYHIIRLYYDVSTTTSNLKAALPAMVSVGVIQDILSREIELFTASGCRTADVDPPTITVNDQRKRQAFQ